jgi:hypothetical protein
MGEPIQNQHREISLVVVSDLHSGSRSSVCVPDMKINGGGSFQYSTAQRALYEAFTGLAREWRNPDILEVNGDAIEGQARKESGVPCWSTDLDDQTECAAQLLKEFNAKKTYIVEGTGYHVDAGGKSLEHYLGEKLNAEKIGSNNSFRAADELILNIGNFNFHFAHHIGVGTGWYKTTPLAREMVFALLTESSKMPMGKKIDCIIRSHVHSFCGVEFTRQRGYITPCWQLQTRYMRKKSPLGMVPDIGMLRFRITNDYIKLDKRFFKPVEAKPKLFRYEITENP